MTNTTKSLLRHFRWYDYVIVVLNVAVFISQLVTSDWMAAFDRFCIIALYIQARWFTNAYMDAMRKNRRMRLLMTLRRD